MLPGQRWCIARHAAGVFGGAGGPGDCDVRAWGVRALQGGGWGSVLHDLHCTGTASGRDRWPSLRVWPGENVENQDLLLKATLSSNTAHYGY